MKHEYAPIGFIYLFGLICASFLSTGAALALSGAAAAVFIITLVLKKRAAVYAAVLCAALLVFGLYSLLCIDPVRALSGVECPVSGTVVEYEPQGSDTARLTVSGSADGIPVKLSLYTSDFGASTGDEISFTAVFSEIRDSAEFSETQYNFSKGIFLKARAADVPVITARSNSPESVFHDISLSLRKRISELLPGEEGGLLRALFFGDRSGLPMYLSALLKRAGLSHMTAVSGMHLSLIVILAAPLIRLIPKRRVYLRFAAAAVFITALMLFYGMTPSVRRSGFMMLLYHGAEPLHRKSSPLHTLGFAAMLITLFQPYACRDMGLWLSILGAFGAGILGPKMTERLIRGRRLTGLKTSVICSLCAMLCTQPLAALCFGGASTVSAVSSLLVYPLFYAALVCVMLTAATGGVLAEIFLLPAGTAARWMIAAAKALGALPFSYLRIESGVFACLIILSFAGLVLAAAFTKSPRRCFDMLLLAVCVFAAAGTVKHFAERDNIVIDLYSDGRNALMTVRSRSGVSAVAGSDGEKLRRELYSRTVGQKTPLICVINGGEGILGEPAQSEPLASHLSGSPDAVYSVSAEYTVTVENGEAVLNVRGTTVGLFPADSSSGADIAVVCGYRKNRAPSGSGLEILCDKRYGGSAPNAYYDKIRIIINADGRALVRRERGAA